MGSTSLESILSEIVAILDSHGHSVEANWISERSDAIERDVSAGSQGALRVALDELHSIVLGMGGLFDLTLVPIEDGDAVEARQRPDKLSDQLYDLTRPV